MAEILSGGLNWGSTQQAIVTMDKEGNPLTCKNPVTGAEISGGGGIETATVQIKGTFSGILGPQVGYLPIIKSADDENPETSLATPIILSKGFKSFNVILHNGRCECHTFEEKYTSVSATGDIEISGTLIIITGPGTLTFVA